MIVKPEIDENKLNIFIVNKYGEWRIYNRIPKRLLNSIYIEEELKIKLLGDIRNFLEREDEYDRFGIPYKKSCLLTGIPGSGKTSIIKAICNEIGYSLSMLSLQKEFDNNSLLHAFGNLEKNSILLLEDIDCIFEHRKASSDTPFLSFSNLLNILDGVLYKHGIIIFITTNHPEKLDHALLRMGRIDMIIQLNYPRETEIKKLFMDINDKLATEDELLLLYNKFYSSIKNKNITMAAIVNFLFKYRMKCIDNIKELIDTNQYLKVLSGDDKKENLYN
jgi:chaperone BCS1